MTDRDEHLFEPPAREGRQALPIAKDGFVGDWLNERVPEEYKDKPGNNWSFDWCAYRRDQRCYFPRDLDERATEEAGYPIWIPVDRGHCPRHKWQEQKDCPISYAGPNSREVDWIPDQTRTWDEGGQRYSSHTAAMDNDRWTKLGPGSYLSPDNQYEAVHYGEGSDAYWALIHYPPRGGDSIADANSLAEVKTLWSQRFGPLSTEASTGGDNLVVGEGDLGLDYCIACGVATDEESGDDYCGQCEGSPKREA